MRLETPFWWYRKRGALASLLAPLGGLYGRVAEARFAQGEPYRSRLPVICIGNFTAGGGGKTPTALAVAALLAELGVSPAFLTRGYGGSRKGPHQVAQGESAAEVGDEALLLAENTPTFVSADRAAGARAIEATQAGAIVMDDGFQNPSLTKDLALVVVDAGSGLGNGLVMPAGPLRAPLEAQIARADALIVIGDGGKAAPLLEAFASLGKPALKARIVPRQDKRWLGVLPVIGFAGIARPEKFFATLRDNGARLIDSRPFPDHHRYSERDARRLLDAAREKNAMLVTTEKDFVRLPDDDEDSALGELKHRCRPFSIAVKFEDEVAVKELLAARLTRPQQSGSRGSA
jgi:tetraacyldisaccharide 4'-kinase